MTEINSKSKLAIVISQLKGFENPKVREEQYITEPEIAAEMLWIMHMKQELDGKTIADLGAGTGILGLGALLLGAKKVFFVDKDNRALDIAKQNKEHLSEQGFELGEAVFVISDISEFDYKVDSVVENPPFGTRKKHADKEFLEKAFTLSDSVYSFHKTSTEKFVKAVSEDCNFKIEEKIDFKFPLHNTQDYHRRKIHRIDVSLFILKKQSSKV